MVIMSSEVGKKTTFKVITNDGDSNPETDFFRAWHLLEILKQQQQQQQYASYDPLDIVNRETASEQEHEKLTPHPKTKQSDNKKTNSQLEEEFLKTIQDDMDVHVTDQNME